MSEKPILGDTRTVYEQIVIALTMGAITLGFAITPEPTWIDVQRYVDLVDQGALLLDVRSTFAASSTSRAVAGATNIPSAELEARLDELPRDRPIIVIGTLGNDSLPSYRLLKSRGFDVYDIGPSTRVPRRLGHSHDHGSEHVHGR